ncbi:MAG: hypothetical protein HZA79_11415 [Sphingobacteriales bacterium]|nr:hypothetical protein [Sphingobacteriales bacterium]
MKKKLLAVFLLSVTLLGVQAQEEQKGWKSDHLFIGTGLNLGFSRGFIIGLNPEVGYSINKILDAGIAMNLTYVTQQYQTVNITARYLALGGGPFVRVWPIEQLFAGGQFEFNQISYSEKADGEIINKIKVTAPSLLVGVGYGSRIIGRGQFYTSIMIDALNDINSPYRDQYNRVLPVFRTGFSFYLGRKKEKD